MPTLRTIEVFLLAVAIIVFGCAFSSLSPVDLKVIEFIRTNSTIGPRVKGTLLILFIDDGFTEEQVVRVLGTPRWIFRTSFGTSTHVTYHYPDYERTVRFNETGTVYDASLFPAENDLPRNGYGGKWPWISLVVVGLTLGSILLAYLLKRRKRQRCTAPPVP